MTRLESTVIGFNDVVQVFARPVFCLDRQPALPLQPTDRFRVGTELVGGDRRRRPVAHRRQRFAQKTMGSASIAAHVQPKR